MLYPGSLFNLKSVRQCLDKAYSVPSKGLPIDRITLGGTLVGYRPGLFSDQFIESSQQTIDVALLVIRLHGNAQELSPVPFDTRRFDAMFCIQALFEGAQVRLSWQLRHCHLLERGRIPAITGGQVSQSVDALQRLT